jgi:hypothetical protein
MSISIGIQPSSLLINGQAVAGATSPALSVGTSARTDEDQSSDEKGGVSVDMNEIGASGGSSGGVSVTTAELLKRLAELQEQLEKVQEQMQAAENASYPTSEAKTTVVMGFQSQISTINGAIQQVSAQLVKEMSQSGGISTTA